MLHKTLTMPYKAVKTDDGVKVVEIDEVGSEIVGKFKYDFEKQSKEYTNLIYPTLPTDNWELDRVYADNEVWIVTDTVPDKSGNPQQVRYAMVRFPGGSPVMNIPTVPNIQEDEDKVWEEAISSMIRYGYDEALTEIMGIIKPEDETIAVSVLLDKLLDMQNNKRQINLDKLKKEMNL